MKLMIIYFSSTGNSKYVAQQLSQANGDEAISIMDVGNEITLKSGEMLGFVTPTYFWGLPSIVSEKLQELEIKNAKDSYIYYIATYGTSSGSTGKFMSDLLKARGLHLDATFSVKMPDNWTVVFDLSDTEKVASINEKEKPQIEAIIQRVKNKETGNFIRFPVPKLISKPFHAMYDKARRTVHLRVTDDCIGCGLCARNCPVNAITMQDIKKPAWTKDQCVMCLGCLHNCPKFAIQYDDKTQKHGQYIHPGVSMNQRKPIPNKN